MSLRYLGRDELQSSHQVLHLRTAFREEGLPIAEKVVDANEEGGHRGKILRKFVDLSLLIEPLLQTFEMNVTT